MKKRKLFRRLMDRKLNLFMPGLISAKVLTMIPLFLIAWIVGGTYEPGTAEFSAAYWGTFVPVATLYIWLNVKKLVPWAMNFQDFFWKVTQSKRIKKFYDTCNVAR